MANKKTGRALLMSALSLLLCCAMLVGTTFAWFTDSASSGINQIITGTLDVELAHQDKNMTTPADVSETTKLFDDIQLWEPGVVTYEQLTVKNLGNLAVKYALDFLFTGENSLNGHSLSEVLKVAVIDNYANLDLTDRAAVLEAAVAAGNSGSLQNFRISGNLEGNTNAPSVLAVVYWEPGADDNNYNVNNGQTTSDGEALHIELGVQLSATQYTSESDAFNDQYDTEAQLRNLQGFGTAAVTGDVAVPVEAWNVKDDTKKVATALVPAAAIADDVQELSLHVVEVDTYENITITDDQDAQTFNVSVSGLKDNNTELVKVEIYIGTGKTGVQVYHYNTLLSNTPYNAQSGYVTFYTTDFSPFTVIYDAEPVVEEDPSVPGAPEQISAIIADVSAQYAGVELPWGSYGKWSPSDVEQQLAVAYSFQAPHTVETVADSQYKDWNCDFFVSIDKDIKEGAIFLGGNYGIYGWVGFENPMDVAANQEIPLLGGVTSYAWTYEQVVTEVGTFLCGVAEANGATESLSGATFTVKLRLTNPENEAEYIDVNEINYTFN